MAEAGAELQRPRAPKLLQVLGPGLVTGASDDDPSGIATYSQVGAQFSYDMGWVMLISWPLMCAIQEISARIGRVTGKGIAGNLKAHYPRTLLIGLVSLLILANTINLGADLGAMGAGLKLVVGGPELLYVALFGLVSILLEVFVRYQRYVAVLKWLTLVLFAYVGVAFIVPVDWAQVGLRLVAPKIQWSSGYLTSLVAILGTTISPYLFFWQASQEVEEVKEDEEAQPLKRAPHQAKPEFARIRLDTYLGMALSNTVGLFIVVTTAATLHVNGVTNIQTSAQAAAALKPIAGPAAFAVFALGIVGTGMLAVPVLAGSAAYAAGEAFGWRVGLAQAPQRAPAFYAAITLATVIGAVLNFTPIDPIKALYWSAVVNGVVAVPVMAMMMHLATRRKIMGRFVLTRGLVLVGWLATGVMALAAAGMIVAMIV